MPQQMQPPIMQMPPPHQPHQPHHQMHPPHHQQHQQHQPHQQHQGHQQHQQPHHQYQQHPPQRYNQNPHMGYAHQQEPQNDKGLIFGEKRYKIMVRELWLGGIPEMIDHHYMTEVMS